MCAFGVLGLSCEAPAAPTCTFERSGASNTTKISREDTQEREERKTIVAGEGKKARNLGRSGRGGSGGGGPGHLGKKMWAKFFRSEGGRIVITIFFDYSFKHDFLIIIKEFGPSDITKKWPEWHLAQIACSPVWRGGEKGVGAAPKSRPPASHFGSSSRSWLFVLLLPSRHVMGRR